MRHSEATTRKRARNAGRGRSPGKFPNKLAPRYSVGLPASLAQQVEHYAETVDTSASKAIATLVRLGLESQEQRKRDFFRRLKENLADDDPQQQDRMVDEFRALILGKKL